MTLHEMFPHYDEDALYNILEASNRDLEETIKIIMENSREQPSLTMADVLKKEKNLCKSLENDRTNKTLRHHYTVHTFHIFILLGILTNFVCTCQCDKNCIRSKVYYAQIKKIYVLIEKLHPFFVSYTKINTKRSNV